MSSPIVSCPTEQKEERAINSEEMESLLALESEYYRAQLEYRKAKHKFHVIEKRYEKMLLGLRSRF